MTPHDHPIFTTTRWEGSLLKGLSTLAVRWFCCDLADHAFQKMPRDNEDLWLSASAVNGLLFHYTYTCNLQLPVKPPGLPSATRCHPLTKDLDHWITQARDPYWRGTPRDDLHIAELLQLCAAHFETAVPQPPKYESLQRRAHACEISRSWMWARLRFICDALNESVRAPELVKAGLFHLDFDNYYNLTEDTCLVGAEEATTP